jgi:phospholipase C
MRIATLPLLALLAFGAAPAQAKGVDQIDHLVVIYLENRSFDNLFALFPGADGLVGKGAHWAPQVDLDGRPYVTLPAVIDTEDSPAEPDPRFPKTLVNAPFLIDQYVPQDQTTPDLVHRFYQNQLQIDGGKMDKFAAISDAGGLVMGFYDARQTKLWDYARRYTLADHYFQGAFGGSFFNHMMLVCACAPTFPNAPEGIVAKLDAEGRLVRDGIVTPDGYAVNTVQTVNTPHEAGTDPAKLLPNQTLPTIGDRLSAKGVSWAWYSGGWNDAMAGHPDPTFQYHHQPFAYFASFGDGTEAKRQHLKDEADLDAAIDGGTLPAVTFFKPLGIENQHPGYSNITNADHKAALLLARLEKSPLWAHMAVIITYDENGGLWDHVAPPKGNRWGPGTRVPLMVISPLARKHYIDHKTYDTTSILKLIETRWGLTPLTERDAKAGDMSGIFLP